MVSLPLVLGIATVAALPAVAFVMTNEYHSLEDDGCALVETKALTAAEGRRVQIRIDNIGDEADLRLCVSEDRNGPERHEQELALDPASTFTFDVIISKSATRVALELDRPGFEMTAPTYAIVASSSSIPKCETGIPQLVFQTEFRDNGSGIMGQKPGCVAG